MTVTYHLSIRGRVQGVGFRYHMVREARSLGVSGWVRNRHDGSVEAIIHGAQGAVEKLVAWTRQGPPGAKVTDVQVNEDSGEFTSFEQRPTA